MIVIPNTFSQPQPEQCEALYGNQCSATLQLQEGVTSSRANTMAHLPGALWLRYQCQERKPSAGALLRSHVLGSRPAVFETATTWFLTLWHDHCSMLPRMRHELSCALFANFTIYIYNMKSGMRALFNRDLGL